VRGVLRATGDQRTGSPHGPVPPKRVSMARIQPQIGSSDEAEGAALPGPKER